MIHALWQELLGEDFMVCSRLSRIYYRERFFDYPLQAVNALTRLGPIETLLIGLSYLKARLRPSQDERNFEQ